MGEINDIGGISLSLFQGIVMITLKLWPLADYFDLDEDYIKKALHYWTECRGCGLYSMKEVDVTWGSAFVKV